jgi:iron(III) transport system substrate-binding protein
MQLRFKPVACAFALAAALSFAACGGDDEGSAGSATSGTQAASADSPEVQKLYESAKGEGGVTWYSSATENVAQKVTDAFNSKYPGVTAEFVRASSPDLIQRYSAEADSGKVAADAGIFPGDAFIPQGIENGWFTPIDQAGIPAVDSGEYPKESIENGEAVAQYLVWQIGYNTELVPEGQEPKTWDEVLDPKWKGKIIIPSPASSDTYIKFFDRVSEAKGNEWLTKLAAQDPIFAESGTPGAQSLAAGEAALMLPAAPSLINALATEGAPLKMFAPPDNTASKLTIGISAKAPHPNAAKLLVNFILSEEGSKLMSGETGEVSPYAGEGDGGFPQGYVPQRAEAVERTDEINGALGVK